MSLFEQYINNSNNEEVVLERVNESNIIKYLGTFFTHMTKIMYIREGYNNTWPVDTFAPISHISKNYNVVRSIIREGKENNILDEGYNSAIPQILKDNPLLQHNGLEFKGIPANRPAMYTFEFITNTDSVKNHIVNYIKKHPNTNKYNTGWSDEDIIKAVIEASVKKYK